MGLREREREQGWSLEASQAGVSTHLHCNPARIALISDSQKTSSALCLISNPSRDSPSDGRATAPPCWGRESATPGKQIPPRASSSSARSCVQGERQRWRDIPTGPRQPAIFLLAPSSCSQLSSSWPEWWNVHPSCLTWHLWWLQHISVNSPTRPWCSCSWFWTQHRNIET